MAHSNAVSLAGGAGALDLGRMPGLDNIIAVALAVVLFGIALYRYGSRIGRARKSIFSFAGVVALGSGLLTRLGGLSWPVSTVAALAAAVATLFLFTRLVPRERRVVA